MTPTCRGGATIDDEKHLRHHAARCRQKEPPTTDASLDEFGPVDFDELDDLRALESEIAEILAADDLTHLAEAMEPGTTAGVLVWENTWASPFAAAARRAGGQLVASGRIPIQAIAASIEAEEGA